MHQVNPSSHSLGRHWVCHGTGDHLLDRPLRPSLPLPDRQIHGRWWPSVLHQKEAAEGLTIHTKVPGGLGCLHSLLLRSPSQFSCLVLWCFFFNFVRVGFYVFCFYDHILCCLVLWCPHSHNRVFKSHSWFYSHRGNKKICSPKFYQTIYVSWYYTLINFQFRKQTFYLLIEKNVPVHIIWSSRNDSKFLSQFKLVIAS